MSTRSMRNRRMIMLVLGAMIIGGIAFYIAYSEYLVRKRMAWLQIDEGACQRAMADIGDVSLDGKTHAELVTIFGKPCQVYEPTGNSSIRNLVKVYWWGDAIEANYVGVHAPKADVTPYELHVRRFFKGSLGGVHLGDTSETFKATERPNCPIFTTVYPEGSKEWIYGRYVDVSGEVHMERRDNPCWTRCVAKHGRIVDVEQWNSHMMLIPQ